ncbi:hypothetical protein AAC03nite_26560 [Alicyclobacillus acidoterrestris]|nr:hypothetical protein AAC03nite_26560 [Alicyclobacillus acidoterrestris]
MAEQWVRLEKLEIAGCKVYAEPTSYILMDAEQREAAWAADVEQRAGAAALWMAAMECAASVEPVQKRKQYRKVVGG